MQERSSSAVALLECVIENPSLAKEMSEIFVGELNPVAPKAQRKVTTGNKQFPSSLKNTIYSYATNVALLQVPIPEDLDLDSWINDPPSESSDSEDVDMNDIFVKAEKGSDNQTKRQSYEPTAEELEIRREARKFEQQNNPHYLKNSKSSRNKKITFYDKSDNNDEDFENIPIAELDIPVSLKVSDSIHSNKLHYNSNKYFDLSRSDESSKKRPKKTSKKKKSRKSIISQIIHVKPNVACILITLTCR